MMGRSTSKPTRDVPGTSQLGAIQTALLEWLLTREEEIRAVGTEQEKLVLEARGVPWNVKLFCKGCEKACKKDGTPDRSKVSTSLKQLDVKKRLVNRHGVRTTHVKLTNDGRTQALAQRADPRPWQEKRAEATARRRANAISYEASRFGDQMSWKELYASAAREAYYLKQLWDMGRAEPYEKRGLSKSFDQLCSSDFSELLPEILQNPKLSKVEVQEVKAIHEAMRERDVYIYVD